MSAQLPVIVLGAGGHGKVVAAALMASGRKVLGFVDRDKKLANTSIIGLPVLGEDELLGRAHPPAGVELANGIGSVESMGAREAVFKFFKDQGYRFATVIHPSAFVDPSVRVGEGCQVMAGAIVQVGAELGPDVIINTRASIDHDCVIGAHTHVAPGAVLSGSVRIGSACHIGTGAVVIQGVQIEDGALVGAGSLLLEKVSARTRVFGHPGRAR